MILLREGLSPKSSLASYCYSVLFFEEVQKRRAAGHKDAVRESDGRRAPRAGATPRHGRQCARGGRRLGLGLGVVVEVRRRRRRFEGARDRSRRGGRGGGGADRCGAGVCLCAAAAWRSRWRPVEAVRGEREVGGLRGACSGRRAMASAGVGGAGDAAAADERVGRGGSCSCSGGRGDDGASSERVGRGGRERRDRGHPDCGGVRDGRAQQPSAVPPRAAVRAAADVAQAVRSARRRCGVPARYLGGRPPARGHR
jgi:hypothetical protein